MLPSQIEALFEPRAGLIYQRRSEIFAEFKARLNRGEIRAAEPDLSSPTGWRVNAWVKKGILLGFRMSEIVDMSIDVHQQPFFDKAAYPVQAHFLAETESGLCRADRVFATERISHEESFACRPCL